MKPWFRYGLAGLAVLGAALLAAPFLLPTDLYKAQIEQGVARATGRKFTIAGPMRFTLFPVLGMTASDVALANPPGWQGPPLVSAKALRIGVKLMPLFSRRLEITEAVLEEPRIALEVNEDGQANWTFFRGHPGAGGRGTSSSSFTPNLSGLRIEGGGLVYSNARTRSVFAIDKLDATASLSALDKPVALHGTFAFRGQNVAFDATTPAPRAPLSDQPAKIAVALRAPLLAASFDGTAAPGGRLAGAIKMDAADLRAAAVWLGVKLPATGGFARFSLASTIKGDDRVAELSGMKLMLDGATITGQLGLDRRGHVPALSGELAVDKLDVDPYITAPHENGTPQPPPHHNEGWSREAIKLDALHEIDANLTLEAGALKIRNLILGRTRIALLLRDSDLQAHLGPMALYGGNGTGELEVDARAPEARFHNAVQFRNVALAPFLTGTIGVKQIEGTGTIALDVSSHGSNADAIMRALSGNGSIDLHDGRLTGVDIGAVARTIQAVLNGAEGPGAFTDYSSMTGSFILTNGVLAASDFQLKGPLLDTSGAGNVDLGNRTIDFRIVPTIAKLGVPFHIKGPWSHVRYAPDFTGLVSGVLSNLASGKAPFKGLFGSSSKPQASKPPADAPKKKHKSAGDALKNMLGIH
jgi:AsmA protein